jgi:hypothetical protein
MLQQGAQAYLARLLAPASPSQLRAMLAAICPPELAGVAEQPVRRHLPAPLDTLLFAAGLHELRDAWQGIPSLDELARLRGVDMTVEQVSRCSGQPCAEHAWILDAACLGARPVQGALLAGRSPTACAFCCAAGRGRA